MGHSPILVHTSHTDVMLPRSDLSITTATLADLLDLFAAQNRLTLPAREYGQLIAQLGASAAWVVQDGQGAPLCIGGLGPVEPHDAEIWFIVQAGGLGRHLLPVVRVTRAILLASRRASSITGSVFTHVVNGHRPGERLAALIGCRPTEQFIGDHRRWEWVR